MIRTAIVGYGRSARVYHLPFLNFLKNYEITSFVSSKSDRLKKDYPDAKVYSDIPELIKNQNIELAIITSPVFAHFDQVKQMLEAKKHVVVEKPFTITSAEAKELGDLAEKNEVQLNIFHNRRWDAGFNKLQEFYKSGEIGEINHLEIHFDRWRPNVGHAWRENLYPGSGIVYELGVHFIDQALQLFGKPQSINVNIEKQRKHSQIDDYYHIVFNYPKTTVVLHSTSLARVSPPHLIAHGENFDLIQHELDAQEQLLIEDIVVGSPEWITRNKTPVSLYHNEGKKDLEIVSSYQNFYEEVAEAILLNKPSPVSAKEVISVMETIEEIYRLT